MVLLAAVTLAGENGESSAAVQRHPSQRLREGGSLSRPTAAARGLGSSLPAQFALLLTVRVITAFGIRSTRSVQGTETSTVGLTASQDFTWPDIFKYLFPHLDACGCMELCPVVKSESRETRVLILCLPGFGLGQTR